MLEYKIITSYYYDGMGNKVMTIAEVDPDSVGAVGYRCNNDTEMYSLYASCTECVDALGLKATYYGREAGGKTLALYDTDPGMTEAYSYPLSCTFNYKYIWLDDWYVYGSEADGRIATVDPKEVIEGSGKRMTGSEFSFPVNTVGSPIDTLKVPIAMRERGINGVTGTYQTQQRIPDFRRYEVKDHLGNVRTVISDIKNPFSTSGPVSNWTYLADIKNISNTYPYGKSYGTNAIYNAVDDYRYGFNGMEKEKNMDASGDITDFGARVYDSEFPMFLSPDPLEKSFSYQSTYITSKNNPIENVDIDGKYSVTAHYNITYNSLMRIGFSSKQSAKIAHYSSVYADHPTLNALTANNILSLSYHQYVKGIDYTPTSESQAESNSKWHAMMSNEEADKGMSHSEAMNRGFEFGWDNILDQSEGLDVGKLGQGLHALQDAYAHKGASTKEHLTAKPTSFYSVTSMYYMINDLYGETNEANHITMSAGIILQAMNGNSSVYTKNGVLLNLEGMTKMQLEKTENILQNAGFEINELNGSKGKFFLMSKIKSKDE